MSRPEESESILEDRFWGVLLNHVSLGVDVRQQYRVNTSLGQFRLDFCLVTSDRAVGVECDGVEFHEPFRDEVRDAAILSQSGVDSIWRFPGPCVLGATEACLALLAATEPSLFDSSVLNRIRPLLRDPSSVIDPARDESPGLPALAAGSPQMAFVTWRSRRPQSVRRKHWETIAARTRAFGHTSIDDYMTWSASQPIPA